MARLLGCLVLVLAGIVLSPLVRRCAPARRDRLVARWARALVRSLGIRVRVTGAGVRPGTAPVAGPAGALVVANHISWLDIALVAAVRPGRMLAKGEIARWPVLGALTARGGTIFIERDRLRALPDTVGEISAALRRGGTVVAFPEGSTWCGRRQGPFRNAVFQAALDASAPVQPLSVRYRLSGGRGGYGAGTTAAAAYVGEDSLLASLRRVSAARGLTAEVSLAPPIPPGAYPDRHTLARAARTAVTGEA